MSLTKRVGLSKSQKNKLYSKKSPVFSIRYRTHIFLAILLLATIIVYSNTFEAPFVFDDMPNILENRHIRLDKISIEDIVAAGFKSVCSRRPVANISFAVNYYIHGYNVTGYHIINILIHLANGIILFYIFRVTLMYSQQHWADEQTAIISGLSFTAAFIWLVHPVQTQSVTYIVQRMNSLAALFYLSSILLYIKARIETQSLKKRIYCFIVSTSCGILALGTKEISVTLPFFIFLYEWFFFQNLSKSWLKRSLPYVLVGMILLGILIRIYLGPNPIELILGGYETREFTLFQRVLTQFRVIIFYLSLVLFPHPARLNLEHDFPLSYGLFSPVTTAICMGLLFLGLASAVYFARSERLVSFSILWFLGNLFLESSIIPLEIIFEHRIYLPSTFLILMGVLLFYRYVSNQKIQRIALVGVCMILCVWTYERNEIWGEELRFLRDCLKKSPNKARIYNNMGFAMERRGNYKDAEKYYKDALSIKPKYKEAHLNIADLYYNISHFDGAIIHYQILLDQVSDDANVHYNLGLAFKGKGELNNAIAQYSKAITLKPDFVQAHSALGAALVKQGKTEEAVSCFKEAIRIHPKFFDGYFNLGAVFLYKKEIPNAIQYLKQAIEIRPDFGEAHHMLGRAYLEEKDRTLAVRHLSKAVEIDPGNPYWRKTLESVSEEL